MEKKYKWLNMPERKQIEKAYADGMSISDIGEMLGKNRGTIYREIQKGYTGKMDANMRPEYSAEVAQARQNTLKAQRRNHGRSMAVAN